MSKSETEERYLSGHMDSLADHLSQYITHQTAFQITNRQESGNRYNMEIVTSRSFYSIGESINVTIEQVEDNKCRVSIQSTLKSKFQQADWHRNRDNIDRVLQGLNYNGGQAVASHNEISKNINSIASSTCQYYGGNENLNKAAMGTLSVYPDKVSFARFVKPNFEIPITQVTNSEVLTQEQILQRPTLTRMLLLGAFSLAIPKREINQFTYLNIKYNDGSIESNLVFKFDGYNSTSKAIKIESAIIKARKSILAL